MSVQIAGACNFLSLAPGCTGEMLCWRLADEKKDRNWACLSCRAHCGAALGGSGDICGGV